MSISKDKVKSGQRTEPKIIIVTWNKRPKKR